MKLDPCPKVVNPCHDSYEIRSPTRKCNANPCPTPTTWIGGQWPYMGDLPAQLNESCLGLLLRLNTEEVASQL
jgi:hypothetical protein